MSGLRTLRGRLMLILFTALLIAQALTFAVVLAERGLVMRGVMVDYVSADLASSVAMLDRLPADERATWLPRLQRPQYQLLLPEPGPGRGRDQVADQARDQARDTARDTAAAAADTVDDPLAMALSVALTKALASPRDLGHEVAVYGRDAQLQVDLRLHDGTPVSILVRRTGMPLSAWMIGALIVQGIALAMVSAVAVRGVTGPLERLAGAARAWRSDRPVRVDETGPREVSEAAAAFNRMGERIQAQLEERNHMLGAIAHDLQTPITRMALRTELLDDTALRGRLRADLDHMQHLVGQGLAYARSAQAGDEVAVSVDIGALVQSIVDDYRDAGRQVAGPTMDESAGPAPLILKTRPRALRRAVENLIDNALKFAGAAEVVVDRDLGPGGAVGPAGTVGIIGVLDRGPGIPPTELERLLRPFEQLTAARDPGVAGHGLGLAIVARLMTACGAVLELGGRVGGGLAATIRLGGLAATESATSAHPNTCPVAPSCTASRSADVASDR